ncbi:MAG TPA: 3-hydroxyacyl-CoA dehydrogenase NAD-binding domain-containing protein, partial [Polyangiaceae bacterium]
MANQRMAVLGTGTMGQGIAQLGATSGFDTHVIDVDESRAKAAVGAVVAQLEKLIAKGKMTDAERTAAVARLHVVKDVASACEGVDVVIEAVPEDMALKVALFQKVLAASPKEALLGSNTSSLSITELGAKIGAPERTVGLHFFNPPAVMELL